MRTVLLVNKSTLIDRDAFGAFAAAMQTQLDRDFAPVYGISLALQVAADHQPDQEAVVFCDTPDVADALGYHEMLQSTETPLGFVFPGLALKYNTPWSGVGSHEVLEQAADPNCCLASISTWGRRFAAIANEVCDPVQADLYDINGVQVSNFVRPSWFDSTAKDPRGYDFMSLLRSPVSLRPGGYISVSYNLREWHQVFAWKHTMQGYRFHAGVQKYKRTARRGKPGPCMTQRPKK